MIKALKIFFSAVYFLALLFVIDLIFQNTLSNLGNFLAIVCMLIAFIVSVGLGDYTVTKIEEGIKNKK